jgi:hypothetical protein
MEAVGVNVVGNHNRCCDIDRDDGCQDNIDDDDDNYNDNESLIMEEHHELVINRSMSIGTDDDNNNNDEYYNSDENDTDSWYSTYNNKNYTSSSINASFLNSTRFWLGNTNTKHNHNHSSKSKRSAAGLSLSSSQQQHVPPPTHSYDFLGSTDEPITRPQNRTNHSNNHTNDYNNYYHNPSRSSSSSGRYRNPKVPPITTQASAKCCCSRAVLLALIMTLLVVVVLSPSTNNSNRPSRTHNNQKLPLPSIHKFKGAPQYTCPTIFLNSNLNVDDASSTNVLLSSTVLPTTAAITESSILDYIQQNMTQYINTFRNRTDSTTLLLDGYDDSYTTSTSTTTGCRENDPFCRTNNTLNTYNQVREHMTNWKTTKYVPTLKKTGASILELNCQIGLNLYMTYDIMSSQDGTNLRDVHLYGIESNYRMAMLANTLLDTLLQMEANFVGGGKRGVICPIPVVTATNDNVNHRSVQQDLSFIPDNSFDLVYTSHLRPIYATWDTITTTDSTEEPNTPPTNESIQQQRHVDICETKDQDWKSMTLYTASQQQQEMLYGQYIYDMFRITKPGNVIAMEHVPIPYCDALVLLHKNNQHANNSNTNPYPLVWQGGVSQSFWYSNVTHVRYKWIDFMDITSIEMEVDTLYTNYPHYHVMMKKRLHPNK